MPDKEETGMKIKASLRVFLLLSLFVIVPFASAIAGGDTRTLIGSKVINFSLPSTQDRLIIYGNEFYGRQNLIITFFPAAFTPV
jgi:hypothetical protein